MKIEMLVLALMLCVVARAERAIEVKVMWLNHAERKCEGCSAQTITMNAGEWCMISEPCGEQRVYLKVGARWQGDRIEVFLSHHKKGEGGGLIDDGPGVSATIGSGDVGRFEFHGFKYAISATAAREKEPIQPAETTRGK